MTQQPTVQYAAIADVGDISMLTSAQIDAKFSTAPGNGTLAMGLILGGTQLLFRRAGKWYYSPGQVIF